MGAEKAQSTEGSRAKTGLVLDFVNVAVAAASLVLAVVSCVRDPAQWFSPKPDVRYQLLPSYTLPSESIAGIQLLNEGRATAQELSLEINTIGGTSVRKVHLAGDLSTQLADTSCRIPVSHTVTCSVSRMLEGTNGAIYLSMDSPDELFAQGVWGDSANKIRQVEHRESPEPAFRVFRGLLFFLGLSTVIRAVGKMVLIWLRRADRKKVPD
jgi:hypothetical protein